MPGWIRSFRDVGWEDEELKKVMQEVQISRPVTFPVGLGKGGGVAGKTSHNGTTGGSESERYHTTSCKRLWIPSPAI